MIRKSGYRFSRLREAGQLSFFKFVQRFGGRRQAEKIMLKQEAKAEMVIQLKSHFALAGGHKLASGAD
jgi:hypothetical protein